MKTPKWLSMIDVSGFSIKAISNRVKQSRSMKKPYINSISFKFLNLRIYSSKKWLCVYIHYALQYIPTGFLQIALETFRRRRMRRLKSDIAFFQPSSRLFQLTYFVKCRQTPGAEFLRPISKFTRRKIISSSLAIVHVLFHKTWYQVFLRLCRKVTTKKCTKKRDISAKFLFCILNLLSFRHSLSCRCRQIVRSLYYTWELSGVLLESKKEIFIYDYNDYSEDDFLT